MIFCIHELNDNNKFFVGVCFCFSKNVACEVNSAPQWARQYTNQEQTQHNVIFLVFGTNSNWNSIICV